MSKLFAKVPKLSKYQKKVSWSTQIAFLLERMDSMFMALALASIVAELHISKAQGGLLPAITVVGALIGGFTFGHLADKYGRVKTLSWSIIIYAVGTALMGFTNSFWMMCVCRIIIGIGTSGEYGIALTMLSEAFSKKSMGKMSSLAGVAGQVGGIVASLLAALVLPNWHLLFFIGIVPVILAVLIRFNLPESHDFVKAQKEVKSNPKEHFAHWYDLFSTPAAAILTIQITIMFMIHIAGYNAIINWLPSIAQTRMHISVAGSSLWMIATIIGMTLGIMVFGWAQDKFGSRWSFGIFLPCAAASVFLLLIAQNKFEFLLAGAVVGFFTDGMFSGYGAIVSTIYPSKMRATANNVIMNIAKSVGSFSTVLVGFLLDKFDLTWVVCFLAGIYMISFVIMLTIKELRPKWEKEHGITE